ncbi:SWIRM_domain-containing protein [Hexamita inflata]|uniref:SWIRM domain-containing protein n=1 Tax=Hexamita inflata TaxID=28002 RepID=A0AA86RI06_9EUKA|nr:SWIRM domain-containing protein [Hexamita inflata]
MSLKLSTFVSIEDWSNYIRSNLQHVVKWTRQEMEQSTQDISVNKCVELVFQLNSRMEDTLGYRSPIMQRFAPKFSRFLFFDVEKDGSLHRIIKSIFEFFDEHKNLEANIAGLTLDNFKLLYDKIYAQLSESEFIDQPTYFLQVKPESVALCTEIITHFRSELTTNPLDADYIIVEQSEFIPQIPSDFQEIVDKLKNKNSSERMANFVDLNKYSSLNRYFLRLTESIENKKTKNSIIAHVRCVPQDYDVAISLKDFINIRQKQTETTQALDLDEFPDKIFYQNDPENPPMIPIQYLTDSKFFNEFLAPFDYVNSIQELNIEKAQQKFAKKNLFQEATTTSQLSHVEQWKCRLRQAENKPPTRHVLNPLLIRGYESFNCKGGIMNNYCVKGQSDKENQTHLHILLQNGVMFGGVPVNTQVKSKQKVVEQRGRTVGRPKKQVFDFFSNDLTLSFYIRYYQKLDFSIQCNLSEVISVINAQGLNFEPFFQKFKYQKQGLKLQTCSVNDQFLKKPEHLSVIQQERLKSLEEAEKIIKPEWFNKGSLAEPEIQLANELDMNPEMLLQARNQIICAWRCLPHLYLTVSACADALQMDYFQVKKIHQFYSGCQLINHPDVIMQSTVPTNRFINLITKQTKNQIMLPCGICKEKFASGHYQLNTAIIQNRFICSKCFQTYQNLDQQRYTYLETTCEWTPADNLVLIETIRKNLGVGLNKLFYVVSEQLDREPEECFMQFIKMTFGKEVQQQNITAQQTLDINQVVARAVVKGRMEEARALLELEKAIEQ